MKTKEEIIKLHKNLHNWLYEAQIALIPPFNLSGLSGAQFCIKKAQELHQQLIQLATIKEDKNNV